MKLFETEYNNEKYSDEMMLWALGKGWKDRPIREAPDRWNSLHPSLEQIKGGDDQGYGLKMMKRLYFIYHSPEKTSRFDILDL